MAPLKEPKGFPFQQYMKVQASTFYLRGVTNAYSCEFTFAGDERKLHVDIQSPSYEEGYFQLTLPSELIPLMPKVYVDGEEAVYNIIEEEEEDEDEESEIYTLEFEYPPNSKSIDIVGGEVRDYRFSYPLVETGFAVSVAHNPPLKPVSVGDELVVTANVQGYLKGYDSLSYVVQVLDEQGITESISITNHPVYAETIYSDLRSTWKPENAGKFRIEALVLANDGDATFPLYKVLMEKMVIPRFEVMQDEIPASRKIIKVSSGSDNAIQPEMVASGENVYLVWANYEPGIPYDEGDLMFAKSSDGGTTFHPAIKISDIGVQERDKRLIAYDKKVFVSWVAPPKEGEQWKPGELFFTKSDDGGETFGETLQLSEGPVAYHVLAGSKEHVYAVWQTYDEQGMDSVMFRSSEDGGKTFGPFLTLGEGQGRSYSPDLAVAENEVFVIWHVQKGEDFGVMLTKSEDFGKTFGKPTELDFGGWGGSDIEIFGNKVYLLSSIRVESTFLDNKYVASDVVLSTSNDGGRTFEKPVNISNSFGESAPIKIIATGKNNENIYVLYADGIFEGANYYIAKSNDGGKTFAKPLFLLGYGSFPVDMEKSRDDVFLLWSSEYFGWYDGANNNTLFVSSVVDIEGELRVGQTTSLVISNKRIGDIHLESTDDGRLYVAWQDSGAENQSILFTKSIDGGITFHEGTNLLPVADAGPDLVVDEGSTVILDANKSYDPDDTGHLAYFWNHVGGPGGEMSDSTKPVITFKTPLVGEDSISRFALTVNDGVNESFPDYVNVHIRNTENHFTFISGATATLDRPSDDFDAGEYFVGVEIFSRYNLTDTGIELDKDSFRGTLILKDEFEVDPDFDQTEIPLRIESLTVSEDLRKLSYSASFVDMPGSVSGVVSFDQPVDFRGLYSTSSDDPSNVMTLIIDNTSFHVFHPGGYFRFD